MGSFIRGSKKHINVFNVSFLAPTQNTPILGPRKKFMCLISWERTQKRDPRKLFGGDFLVVAKGVPNRLIAATKSLVYFFSCPYQYLEHRKRFGLVMDTPLKNPFKSSSTEEIAKKHWVKTKQKIIAKRHLWENWSICNSGITVTDSLPTLIVWELIADYRYRLRNSRNLYSQLIVGLPLPTLMLSELITVRITVTDTDFNFLELDRSSLRCTRAEIEGQFNWG